MAASSSGAVSSKGQAARRTRRADLLDGEALAARMGGRAATAVASAATWRCTRPRPATQVVCRRRRRQQPHDEEQHDGAPGESASAQPRRTARTSTSTARRATMRAAPPRRGRAAPMTHTAVRPRAHNRRRRGRGVTSRASRESGRRSSSRFRSVNGPCPAGRDRRDRCGVSAAIGASVHPVGSDVHLDLGGTCLSSAPPPFPSSPPGDLLAVCLNNDDQLVVDGVDQAAVPLVSSEALVDAPWRPGHVGAGPLDGHVLGDARQLAARV